MTWRPDISAEHGPLPERILAALRRDIASGDLAVGTRLPPQRDLAFQLGVSLGVVTRAYAEAERLGLTSGQVGRGTYVQAPANGPAFTMTSTTDGLVDLARNYPPLGAARARLREALEALSRTNAVDFSLYGPALGLDGHRQAAARWLRRSAGIAVDWNRILLTTGAQQAIYVALGALLTPGDTLMCEAATFHGVKLAAAQGRFKLMGLAMDDEGVLPDALERAARTGARVAYLTPTLQNPTGRAMSPLRREHLVRIARERDLILIEDDVYAAYAGKTLGDCPPTLASLAPERVLYLSGASKSLMPGLRLGFLVAPDEPVLKSAAQVLRASVYSTPAFGAQIFTHWEETGEADEIAAQNRADAAARQRTALGILGGYVERPGSDQSLHLWLPMSEAAAERTAARALRAGVEVTPPSAPVVDSDLISGLRLCLGQTEGEQLEASLRALRPMLADAADPTFADVL
jgi:DNA-binding transcriptional MocR family regulator